MFHPRPEQALLLETLTAWGLPRGWKAPMSDGSAVPAPANFFARESRGQATRSPWAVSWEAEEGTGSLKLTHFSF